MQSHYLRTHLDVIQEEYSADFGHINMSDPSQQIQNMFENEGIVGNQAGQQIIHGDVTINQSM
jgi:hypothetical protein